MDRIPYQPILYALPEEWLKADRALRQQAADFQPTLYRMLRLANRHALIFFVTNYIDYAPAGYEVQAFRHILKQDMDEVLERYILQAMENMAESQEFLRLRDKEQTVDLPLEQIAYLEVLDNYDSVEKLSKDGEQVYSEEFRNQENRPAPQIRFVKK